MVTFCCVNLLFNSAIAGGGGDERLPKIILSGLDDYKSFGNKKAVITWLKNGPYENTVYANTLIDNLNSLEELYGGYKNYDLIKKLSVSNNIQYLTFAIYHDKGPIFAKFMVYYTSNEWIICNIDIDKKIENIIPDYFISSIILK